MAFSPRDCLCVVNSLFLLCVSQALTESPGILNEDPMGKGWFIKIKMAEPAPDTLMDPAAYEAHCEESG